MVSWLLTPTSNAAEPFWVAIRTRTTSDLVTSCLVTLLVCVWTAVHLNIPSFNQRTTRTGGFDRMKSRFTWMLFGLFAPEVVLWSALHQFLEARAIALQLAHIDKVNKTEENEKYANDSAQKSPIPDLENHEMDANDSAQKSPIPDLENQYSTVDDDKKEGEIQSVGNQEDIIVEEQSSKHTNVTFDEWMQVADNEEKEYRNRQRGRSLQHFPRIRKVIQGYLAFLGVITKFFSMIYRHIKKPISKLAPIWGEVKRPVINGYYFCFPHGLEKGFYIVMGGYEVHRPAMKVIPQSFQNILRPQVVQGKAKVYLSDKERKAMVYGEPWTLNSRAVITLEWLGLLPKMRREDIKDKSKADSLAKTFVCLQASWMLIQCIARKASGLPITLLEVNTVMHVVCALLMYLFWLYKPQNVTEPTRVRWNPGVNSLLSLKYRFEVLDEHHSGRADVTLEWSSDGGFDSSDSAQTILDNAEKAMNSRTNKTVAITVKVDKEFVLKITHSALSTVYKRDYDIWVDVEFPTKEDINGLCEILTKFKRRISSIDDLKDVWKSDQHPFISDAAITQYASNLPMDDRARYFTSMMDISTGPGILLATIVTAIYGGVHLAPWNGHFATHLERILWRASGIMVASGGVLWGILVVLEKLVRHMDDILYFRAFQMLKELDLISALILLPMSLLVWIFLILYPLARVYMVAEAFASLRSLPFGAYQTVNWAQMIPHL